MPNDRTGGKTKGCGPLTHEAKFPKSQTHHLKPLVFFVCLFVFYDDTIFSEFLPYNEIGLWQLFSESNQILVNPKIKHFIKVLWEKKKQLSKIMSNLSRIL